MSGAPTCEVRHGAVAADSSLPPQLLIVPPPSPLPALSSDAAAHFHHHLQRTLRTAQKSTWNLVMSVRLQKRVSISSAVISGLRPAT